MAITAVKENSGREILQINFAKRSFLLIGSSISRVAVQFLVIFLYARTLSVIDYGLYQSVWLFTNLISVIGLFGLPAFLLSASAKNIRTSILQSKKAVTAIILLNLIPIAFFLFTATNFSATTRLLLVTLTIVQNAGIIAEALCIKKEKEKLVLITNIVINALYLLWHVFLMFTTYSLQWLLAGLTVIFLLKVLVQWQGFGRDEGLDRGTEQTVAKKQWIFLGLYDIAGVVSKWIDKWVILSFISVTQFATYFNGSYELPVFALMVTAVGNIMVIELAKEKDDPAEKIKLLFYKSTALLAAFVFPCFCFLFFYHEAFIHLLFGPKYHDAIPVFLISIFILPLRITNTAAALQVYQRNDLIAKGAVLEILLAIVLMLILYPILHLRGLALAFVLSTYVQIAYYLWHTGKLINKPVSYFFPVVPLLVTFITAVVVTATGYYLTDLLAPAIHIFCGAAIAIALSAFFLYGYYRRYRTMIK